MAKVSLYISDDAWNRFREQVFSRYGTLRKLSEEVEGRISAEDMEKIIESWTRTVGIPMDRHVTSGEIKRNRPKSRGASTESILRKMRDRRLGRRVLR